MTTDVSIFPAESGFNVVNMQFNAERPDESTVRLSPVLLWEVPGLVSRQVFEGTPSYPREPITAEGRQAGAWVLHPSGIVSIPHNYFQSLELWRLHQITQYKESRVRRDQVEAFREEVLAGIFSDEVLAGIKKTREEKGKL